MLVVSLLTRQVNLLVRRSGVNCISIVAIFPALNTGSCVLVYAVLLYCAACDVMLVITAHLYRGQGQVRADLVF